MDPTFSLKGGAAVDWWNVTIPFARLSGDREALRLSCFRQDYVFDRSTIESLSRYRAMFSVGLRIEHTVALYPKFVVFWVSVLPWSKRFLTLKEELELSATACKSSAPAAPTQRRSHP